MEPQGIPLVAISQSPPAKLRLAWGMVDLANLCLLLPTSAELCSAWGMVDSICIFAFGKNYCSHQFLNWWQQLSTGQLH